MGNPILLYDNRFKDTTSLTASTVSSDTSFNVANVIDSREYTFWQSGSSTGTHFITVDTSNATAGANALGIIGHNLFSASSVIAVQHSSDNFASITTAATFAPTDNKSFMVTFTSAANRYWRIAIPQPTTAAVKIGVAVLGKKFTFERGVQRDINPDYHTADVNQSDSKRLYNLGSDVRGKMRQIDLQFTGLSATWVESTFLNIWTTHLEDARPFFFNWNTAYSTAAYFMHVVPGSAFTSKYMDDNTKRDLQMTLRGRFE